MNAMKVIETSIDTANMISLGYVGDLSDEELMHRPHPKCNHIKWQLGHLISSDYQMICGCRPGALPELPSGFSEKYTKETATSDDPNAFHSKEELLDAHSKQTAAIKELLTTISESDLDAAAPEEMQGYAANFGAALAMISSHWLMHAGQWAVVRRQKNREPLF